MRGEKIFFMFLPIMCVESEARDRSEEAKYCRIYTDLTTPYEARLARVELFLKQEITTTSEVRKHTYLVDLVLLSGGGGGNFPVAYEQQILDQLRKNWRLIDSPWWMVRPSHKNLN